MPKVVTRWRKVVRRSDGHLQRGRRWWVEVVLRPDVGAAVARAPVHDRGRGHGWKKQVYRMDLLPNRFNQETKIEQTEKQFGKGPLLRISRVLSLPRLDKLGRFD